MKKNLYESSLVDSRMKSYLQKIATGPKMSRDLTEVEAEDALTLILKDEVSKVKSGVFLIAARMKLETLEENIGTLIDALKKTKPSSAKGVYFKKISVSSTMGPGLAIDAASVDI